MNYFHLILVWGTLVCLGACEPASLENRPDPGNPLPSVAFSTLEAAPVWYATQEEEAVEDDFLDHMDGPALGGTIHRVMTYNTFMVPQRVGVFALQDVDGAPRILGEVAGIEVYTAVNDTFDYQLNLPSTPHAEYLLPTDDGLRMGRFGAALYYDANGNDRWDPEEYIGAAHRAPESLVYFAPDTDPAPPVAGWSFVQEEDEGLEVLPWNPLAQSQNLNITTAPVHYPVVRGTLAGDLPGSLRMGFAIVDGPQLESLRQAGADPWSLAFDPASSHQVLNMSIINDAFEGTLAYPLDDLDAATVAAWSLVKDVEPGVTITYLPVLAFSYLDVDGDRRLSAGDTLAEIPDVPDGEHWTFAFVLEMPREWGLLAPEALFLHAGYNWWSAPPVTSSHHFLNHTTFREWIVSIPMIPRP